MLLARPLPSSLARKTWRVPVPGPVGTKIELIYAVLGTIIITQKFLTIINHKILLPSRSFVLFPKALP